MNIFPEREHAEWVQDIARGYSERGFEVVTFPSSEHVPFELTNCQPSLIARKGELGVVCEVRTRLNPISPSRLFDLGEETSSHRGWRFMYATVEDMAERNIIFELSELPLWTAIKGMLTELDVLHSQHAGEPALLYAWRICEAALRRMAMEDYLPMEQLPTRDLIANLYTFGEIPLEHFEALKATRQYRDLIVQGQLVQVDMAKLLALVETLNVTVSEYLVYREEKRLRYLWQAQALA